MLVVLVYISSSISFDPEIGQTQEKDQLQEPKQLTKDNFSSSSGKDHTSDAPRGPTACGPEG
jgi:hypothetical protein